MIGKADVREVPATMKAVEITRPGGPDVLRLTDRPMPVPGPDEVLIQVAAAGVNRPDVFQREGAYPPPPGASDIPGLEVAGRIVGLGDNAAPWKVGDTACALVAGGGYAAYALAPARQVLPVPDGLDLVQAAALPETFFTVWTNLFESGALSAGETVLIHGGSSGIGTTAIQLGRAFGAEAIVTVGSDEKAEFCAGLGAATINYRTQNFMPAVKEMTDGKGVNVVLCMVGGSYLADNVACLADGGRLVIIALLGGAEGQLNLSRVMRGRLTITGSTLRPRSVAEKGRIAEVLRERVWPLLAKGDVRPVIHATFPLAEAANAHALMESSTHVGKIVLTV